MLLCTTKLAQSTAQSYFVLQSLQKALPSTTLYYKACTKYRPVLLCDTKLAQGTSQYYCVLQCLDKVYPITPITTLCYKAYAPECYFVLQSLNQVPRSTTLYYKACTKYRPVQPCTTKLEQGTSQYYFALQSLHKVPPSITLY